MASSDRQGSSLLISQVYPDTLEAVWSALLPQIKKGLRHGMGDGTSPEHLYEQIKLGKMGMWVIHNPEIKACAIYSILEHPSKKTIFVEMLAGADLGSWIDEVQDAVRKMKREIGADTIEASCRKGMTQVLSKWQVKSYIMEFS